VIRFNGEQDCSDPDTMNMAPHLHFASNDDGKTLEEERAGRSDFDSKYGDSVSYSNFFIEQLSRDSVLVLYNDLKYDEGDGVCHKATFVREITV